MAKKTKPKRELADKERLRREIVEMTEGQHRLASATGRASFSILLFQDLAVVPLILLVGILGAGAESSVAAGLIKAFGQAAIAIAVIVAVGLVPVLLIARFRDSPAGLEPS